MEPQENTPTPQPMSAPAKITPENCGNVELEPSRIHAVRVITDVFEGPLDLLWFLIRKERLDIFSVSLASITEQYLEHLRLMESLDLELAGEYLLVAGILVEYKSRCLLPTSVAPPDEEEEVPDLQKRLQEYVVFKEIAARLQEQYQRRQSQFSRPPVQKTGTVQETENVDFADIDLFDLYAAFKRILDEIGSLRPVTLTDEDFTVEEKMEELRHVVSGSENWTLNFSEHLRQMRSKIEIIVTLLALLELLRLRLLRVRQLRATMDIYVIAITDPNAWLEENGHTE